MNEEIKGTELVEVENTTTELAEVDNCASAVETSNGGMKVAVGIALIGAVATGVVALRRKGILKSRKQRAMEYLEKQGCTVIMPDDEPVEETFEEEVPEEESVEETKTASAKGKKKAAN